MRVKTIIAGALCLALAAMVGFTPMGLPGALEVKSHNDEVVRRQLEAVQRLGRVEDNVVSVVDSVNAEREFDVYYGDIENLSATFRSMGLQIDDLVEVYPMEDFKQGTGLVEGSAPAAVCYKLTCESIMSALGVLEQMELPIYSVVIDGEHKMEVTFMTGGSL